MIVTVLSLAVGFPASAQEAANIPDIGAIKPTVDSIELRPDWETIEIRDAKPDEYFLTLWYRESAFIANQAVPESDTKFIARALLSALVKQGRAPATEHIVLRVGAMRHIHGETGAKLVQWYGNTDYDYNDDSLTYKACDRKSWFGC
jgi:hypothetical protein